MCSRIDRQTPMFRYGRRHEPHVTIDSADCSPHDVLDAGGQTFDSHRATDNRRFSDSHPARFASLVRTVEIPLSLSEHLASSPDREALRVGMQTAMR